MNESAAQKGSRGEVCDRKYDAEEGIIFAVLHCTRGYLHLTLIAVTNVEAGAEF